MKQFIAKSVFVALGVAFTACAFAQASNSEKKEQNNKPVAAQISAEECAKYIEYLATTPRTKMNAPITELDSTLFVDLFSHNNEPLYTSVEGAGLVAGRRYAAGDSICVMIVRKDNILKLSSYPIRTNEKEAAAAAAVDAKLKLAAARAWSVEELNEGRPRSGREFVATLSNGQTVTIPTQMGDDFGWSVGANLTYQSGENRNAFGGEVKISYDHQLDKAGKWFVGGQILGGLRKSFLNDNAVNAGDNYLSYGTSADFMFGHTFGKHRQLKVALTAGLNWEFYKTDSQARYYEDSSWDELSGEGNYLSPEFFLHLGYRGLGWPVELTLDLGVQQVVSVWQGPNDQTIRRFDPKVRFGIDVPIFRNVTNNK